MKKIFILIAILVVPISISVLLLRRNSAAPAKSYAASPPPEREQLLAAVRNNHDYPTIAAQVKPLCQRWIEDYKAVLREILAAGFKIEPLENFDPAAVDARVAYLRHDVHYRDIFGAFCMMATEHDMSVAATYYLLWDYNRFEIEKRADYELLEKMTQGKHGIGLHMSMGDEYFYWEHCKDNPDPKCLQNFLNEFIKTPEFNELAKDPGMVNDPDREGVPLLPPRDKVKIPTLRNLLKFADQRMAEHLSSMREHFGQVVSLASHSGEVGALTAKLFASDNTKDAQYLGSTSYFLTQKTLDRLGIKTEAYQIQRQYGLLGVTDSDINMRRFKKSLTTTLQGKRSFVILIHPAVWEAGLIQATR